MARIKHVVCTSREFLLACSECRWEGLPGRCRWCNVALGGRRRVWCSTECNVLFGANHYWTQARSRRARTDGFMCVDCGIPTQRAFEKAVRDGWGELDALRAFRHLEVHHLIPVEGRHAENGCHHHQSGLRTVCRHHHVERHRLLRLLADKPAQLVLIPRDPYRPTAADEALARLSEAFTGA